MNIRKLSKICNKEVTELKTPIIETERLILRPLKVTDAKEVFENWASDPRVAKYMRYSTHESADVTREWLEAEEKAAFCDDTYDFGFVLKENGKLIGSGGLLKRENGFELGYNIMYDCWNKGYTTEAASAIIKFGREKLGIKRFIACHAVENIASGKVISKLGFKFIGNSFYYSFDKTKKFNAKDYILEF